LVPPLPGQLLPRAAHSPIIQGGKVASQALRPGRGCGPLTPGLYGRHRAPDRARAGNIATGGPTRGHLLQTIGLGDRRPAPGDHCHNGGPRNRCSRSTELVTSRHATGAVRLPGCRGNSKAGGWPQVDRIPCITGRGGYQRIYIRRASRINMAPSPTADWRSRGGGKGVQVRWGDAPGLAARRSRPWRRAASRRLGPGHRGVKRDASTYAGAGSRCR